MAAIRAVSLIERHMVAAWNGGWLPRSVDPKNVYGFYVYKYKI
jgi:hypothetical protein